MPTRILREMQERSRRLTRALFYIHKYYAIEISNAITKMKT